MYPTSLQENGRVQRFEALEVFLLSVGVSPCFLTWVSPPPPPPTLVIVVQAIASALASDYKFWLN